MNQRAPSAVFLMITVFAASATRAQTTTPPPGARAQPGTITASGVCGAGATYEQLTGVSRSPSPPQIIPFGTAPVELTISSTEFSDRRVDAKTAASQALCWDNTLSVGVDVSTAGEIASFANGEGSFRGGGGGKLAALDFARLESLMENLPDDGHRVPPADRRIMVRVQRNGGETVRLYDNANLPDEIVDMIRITGARIKVQMPVFQPDKVWSPEETQSLDLPKTTRPWGIRNPLIVSPDGSVGVLHDFVTKTLTVYSGGDWPMAGMPDKSRILRVLPEFWQPDTYGGYAVGGEFSPNGRYLLVRWGNRIGALLYDTATWQPVTDPRLFPQNLKEYLPSPDWDLGVAVTAAGETLIWDQLSHRILSKLPGLGKLDPPPVITNQKGVRVYTEPSAEIQAAAFSPDHMRVAIYGGPDDVHKLRLSIWDIESGQVLKDLSPMEWFSYANGAPFWWKNGRWLLARYASQFGGGGIGLWDVETGRFKGTLDLATEKCDAREDLIVSGSRLLERCFAGKNQDGKVLEWSVDGVTNQMSSAASRFAGVPGSSK